MRRRRRQPDGSHDAADGFVRSHRADRTCIRGALRSARRLSTLKGRRAAEQFLAEGPQAVREAVTAGLVQRLFVTKAGADRHPDVVQDAASSGAVVSLVGDPELASLTDTVTPQGLVAVCRTVETSLDDVIAGAASRRGLCSGARPGQRRHGDPGRRCGRRRRGRADRRLGRRAQPQDRTRLRRQPVPSPGRRGRQPRGGHGRLEGLPGSR